MNKSMLETIEYKFKADGILSIVTNQFSDIDLKRGFEGDYNVICNDESATWDKTVERLMMSIQSPFQNHKLKKICIINLDMITRIPKEGKERVSKKSKKKQVSVMEFIEYLRFSAGVYTIFFSEKSLVDYKFPVKPFVVGDIIDISNKMFVVKNVVYGKDPKILGVIKENSSPISLMGVTGYHYFVIGKYDKFYKVAKLYASMFKEVKSEIANDVFFSMLADSDKPIEPSYPSYYKKLFNLKYDINEL